jgi:hypothetical protein
MTQIPQNTEISTPSDVPETGRTKRNIYPYVRHVFLACIILFAIAAIVFLIYQNGKSIYDNGI